ncbi:insulinase family protein [Candidatus Pacearchaeota archaeon]|jgi:predicted Zn-dependent peptidase|nr:insulinase family protein [Candidatus Pacearchaeota archaeon]
MKPLFYRKVLKNGMTIIFEKRDLPIVAVAFAVRNGGINETPSEKGISHFIEHMLYKGTPTRNSKQIAEEIEKKGGELNGFTDELVTAYWCKMPHHHLGVALEVLSDMIKNPLFDEKELEKERKVIFEEIKMRRDIPHIYIMDKIENELYTGTLGKSLIGTYETMSSIDRKKIVKKFNEVYTPNNFILCVVGDANFDEIVKFAENNFGNVKGKVPNLKFSPKNGTKIEKRKGIDQANLVFAYHVPLATNKKSYSALVLSTLMAGGMSSRLFSEIREKRNLAYSIKGESNVFNKFAYNLIWAGTTKDKIKVVKELILQEFKKVSKELSEKELNEVKEQIIGNYHISQEESQTQMVNLLMHEIDGDAREFYDFEKNIRNVKLQDVKELAKIKKYSFLALLPE